MGDPLSLTEYPRSTAPTLPADRTVFTDPDFGSEMARVTLASDCQQAQLTISTTGVWNYDSTKIGPILCMDYPRTATGNQWVIYDFNKATLQASNKKVIPNNTGLNFSFQYVMWDWSGSYTNYLCGVLATANDADRNLVTFDTSIALTSANLVTIKAFLSSVQRTGAVATAASTTSFTGNHTDPEVLNDQWKGLTLTFTSGNCNGQTQAITAYTAATKTFTTNAFTLTPSVGSAYRLNYLGINHNFEVSPDGRYFVWASCEGVTGRGGAGAGQDAGRTIFWYDRTNNILKVHYVTGAETGQDVPFNGGVHSLELFKNGQKVLFSGMGLITGNTNASFLWDPLATNTSATTGDGTITVYANFQHRDLSYTRLAQYDGSYGYTDRIVLRNLSSLATQTICYSLPQKGGQGIQWGSSGYISWTADSDKYFYNALPISYLTAGWTLYASATYKSSSYAGTSGLTAAMNPEGRHNGLALTFRGSASGAAATSALLTAAGQYAWDSTNSVVYVWGFDSADLVNQVTNTSGAVVANASNTTTTFKTNLPSAVTDFYKGRIIEFTGNFGTARRRITAYNATTQFVTVDSALHAAVPGGELFTVLGHMIHLWDWRVGANEIQQVWINETANLVKIRRICHMHAFVNQGDGDANFDQFPKLSASKDGQLIAFASPWGGDTRTDIIVVRAATTDPYGRLAIHGSAGSGLFINDPNLVQYVLDPNDCLIKMDGTSGNHCRIGAGDSAGNVPNTIGLLGQWTGQADTGNFRLTYVDCTDLMDLDGYILTHRPYDGLEPKGYHTLTNCTFTRCGTWRQTGGTLARTNVTWGLSPRRNLAVQFSNGLSPPAVEMLVLNEPMALRGTDARPAPLDVTPAIGSGTFASVASGNWSSATTWSPITNAPPKVGDKAIISVGHTVTVTVDTEVGDSAPGNADVLSLYGTLSLAANKTLTIHGGTTCYPGVAVGRTAITGAAGSALVLDAIAVPAFLNHNDCVIRMNGTSVTHCTIRGLTAGGPKGYLTSTTISGGFQLLYTDVLDIGDVESVLTRKPFYSQGAASGRHLLDHVSFLRCPTWLQSRGTIDFIATTFATDGLGGEFLYLYEEGVTATPVPIACVDTLALTGSDGIPSVVPTAVTPPSLSTGIRLGLLEARASVIEFLPFLMTDTCRLAVSDRSDVPIGFTLPTYFVVTNETLKLRPSDPAPTINPGVVTIAAVETVKLGTTDASPAVAKTDLKALFDTVKVIQATEAVPVPIVRVIPAFETIGLRLTDVSTISNIIVGNPDQTLIVSETMALSVADSTSALSAIGTAVESLKAGLTEAVQLFLAPSETTALRLAEAASALATVVTTDLISLGAVEVVVTRTINPLDTLNLQGQDVATLAATVTCQDSLSLTLTETASLATTFLTFTISDSLALSITEVASDAVALTAVETLQMLVQDVTSATVTATCADVCVFTGSDVVVDLFQSVAERVAVDTIGVTLSEAATVQQGAAIQAVEASALRLTEVVTLTVVLTTFDTVTVDSADILSLSTQAFPIADAVTVSAGESVPNATVGLTAADAVATLGEGIVQASILLTSADVAALPQTDLGAAAITYLEVPAADVCWISLTETAVIETTFLSFTLLDAVALPLADSSTVDSTVTTADAVTMACDEASLALWTELASYDAITVQLIEPAFSRFTQAHFVSDTCAVQTDESLTYAEFAPPPLWEGGTITDWTSAQPRETSFTIGPAPAW